MRWECTCFPLPVPKSCSELMTKGQYICSGQDTELEYTRYTKYSSDFLGQILSIVSIFYVVAKDVVVAKVGLYTMDDSFCLPMAMINKH